MAALRFPDFVIRMLSRLPHRLCAVATVLLIAAPVSAQAVRPLGSSTAFNPDFIQRDLHVLAEAVGITDDQRPVIEALFSDYNRAFTEGRDAARKRMAEMRPEQISDAAAVEHQASMQREIEAIVEAAQRKVEATDDPDEKHRIMNEAQEQLREFHQRMADFGPVPPTTPEMRSLMRQMESILHAWEREKLELFRGLLEDIRTVLDDAQRERWPFFERRLRRDRTLSRGRLSGEGVDLHAIMLRFDLPEEADRAVEDALLAYAVALDAALVNRNDQLHVLETRLREAAEGDDADGVRQSALRITLLHQAVRDVNLDHLDRLRAVLPQEIAVRTVAIFDELAFPRFARTTRTGRVVLAAGRVADLTEEQAEAIAEVAEEYRVGMIAHLDSMRSATVIGEPQALQRVLVQGTGSIVDAPVIRSAQQARDEFEATIMERLRGILAPQQLERIPFANEPSVGRQNWGEGRDGSASVEDERELLRRFDLDGDGRLDAAERAAMIRYLESRRRNQTPDE